MDTLVQYGGSSSSDSDTEPPVSYGAIASFKNKFRALSSTPEVVERDEIKPYDFIAADAKVLQYNPTVEQMYAPKLGPTNPFKTQQALAQKNMFCGFVENTGVRKLFKYRIHFFLNVFILIVREFCLFTNRRRDK